MNYLTLQLFKPLQHVSLDAQRRTLFPPRQDVIKNHSRNKNRSKQVGKQADRQRHGKTANRPRSESKENGSRNDSGNVGINDRPKSLFKSCRNRASNSLTQAAILRESSQR